VPDARSANGAYGGVIIGVQGCTTAACTTLVNQQFLPGGALAAFHQGSTPGASYASGGDGGNMVFGISPALDRESAFLHGEWDVNSDLTLFAEGMFNRTNTSLQAQSPYQTGAVQFTIFRNNAYLPSAVASVFAANPTLASFTMGRLSPDMHAETVNTLEEVGRVSFGAKGHVGDRWTYDAAIAQQYTVNNLDVLEPIERNLYAAADAVTNASGQIVCNSTLSGLDPGCVPVNLFGAGSPSQAAVNYIDGINRGDTIFRQTSFEANLRGDLGEKLSFGAGPISLATGLAIRYDNANRTVDALSTLNISCTGLRGCPTSLNNRYGSYQYYNPGPLQGSTNSKEIYAEVGVPLLRDLPLAQSLSTDLAARWTDYSVSGGQWTYKVGLQWQINHDIKLRGTTSQDVRAPDVLELFSTAATKVSFDLFPSSTAPVTTRVSAVNASVGNPKLDPEIAHTSTAGVVLSPSFAPGLQMSVDYYHVQINHSIEALIAQGVVDGCAAGNASYCKLITVNGVPITSTSQVTAATTGLTVTGPRANVGTETTSGVDIEGVYTRRMGEGTLTARAIANVLMTVDRPTAITGCAQTGLVGAIGGCLGQDGFVPWKLNLSVGYRTDQFGVFVQERVLSSGHADPWDVVGVTVTRNAVPMVEYTDLTVDYALGRLFHAPGRIYLNVTNLTNVAPPPTIISSGAFDGMISQDVYDVLGRRFVLGYRVSF
jgi:outer membrane receptor protein involved in Fe transport